MKKMIITGIAAAGLIFGGASFAGAAMNNNDEVKDKAEVVETKGTEGAKGKLSIEKVKEIALSEYEGHVENIEFEYDDGYAYYEVDMEDGNAEYEIYIEAYTGEIIATEIDHHDDKDDRKISEKLITADEAKKIAVEQVGGEVKDIELDEDDERYEYELELRTKTGKVELTIDAATGDILEQEMED